MRTNIEDLQENMMWSMLQDLIHCRQWTADYCSYRVQQFEKIYPSFRESHKGWLEGLEDVIEHYREENRRRDKEIEEDVRQVMKGIDIEDFI